MGGEANGLAVIEPETKTKSKAQNTHVFRCERRRQFDGDAKRLWREKLWRAAHAARETILCEAGSRLEVSSRFR